MINSALFKEQMKRFWPIAALASLAYFVGVLMPLYSMDDSWRMGRYLTEILSMQNFGVVLGSVLVPFLAAFCTLRYFFNSRTTTYFYSFPMNKQKLVFTNVLAGVALMLIPLLVLGVGLLLVQVSVGDVTVSTWRDGGMVIEHRGFDLLPPVLAPNTMTQDCLINSLPRVGGFLLRLAIAKLFYFALFWLAFSLSGHAVIGVLLAGTLPFIPVAVVMLWHLIAEGYVFGYTGSFFDPGAFLAYYNPALWGLLIRRVPSLVPFYFIYAALTMVWAACAYFVSHVRKPERTGNSIVFEPVKQLLIFMLSMAGMVIVGVIFAGTMGTPVAFHIGLVLGFAITYLIAQMIAEKTFHIGHKLKSAIPFGAVMIALYVLMFFTTQVGMNFYVNNIPAAETVESVHIGRWRSSRFENTFIDDRQTIEHTLEVHRQILASRSYLHEAIWRTAEGFDSDERIWSDMFAVTYRLTNGGYVDRIYRIPDSFLFRTGMYELLDSGPVLISQHPALTNPNAITQIDLWYHPVGEEWSGRRSLQINDQWHIHQLVEAIMLDLEPTAQVRRQRQRADSEDRWGRHHDVLEISLSVPWNPEGIYRSTHMSLTTVDNTLAMLESLGLEDITAMAEQTDGLTMQEHLDREHAVMLEPIYIPAIPAVPVIDEYLDAP